MNQNKIDISEEEIVSILGEDVLELLLYEHAYDFDEAESKKRHHIYWATDMYEKEGQGFQFADEIQIKNITGEHYKIVRPRITKSKEEQEKRTRDKAEVFTPSWVCNAQNNMVDSAWFGRENVFNYESYESNKHVWIPIEDKISFPEDKTWMQYVNENRLEMACGEAPYLVSRYDTTTGEYFDYLNKRIGILDRKLRVVGENVDNLKDWYFWAINAIKSTYGFEWQGDNLLLAREAILFSFIDYFKEFTKKHNIKSKLPHKSLTLHVAKIISWNIFQMDGIKMVLPSTCHNILIKGEKRMNLFESYETEDRLEPCEGCNKNDVHKHNGVYQLVAEWNKSKWSRMERPMEIVEFHTLINK